MTQTLWLDSDAQGGLSASFGLDDERVGVNVFPTPFIPDSIRLPASLGGAECRVVDSHVGDCITPRCGKKVLHLHLDSAEQLRVASCFEHDAPYMFYRLRK